MKVIYMGTPDFAVGALENIIKAGHEVTLVVTQPDKPKGRSKELVAPPVKVAAMAHNIPVFQPDKIKKSESVEYLRQYEADVFVVCAFGQILSSEILNMPKYGCINIHASLLPKYRGAAPIQWVIINGEKETGVTIMQMDEGLDTGDMLYTGSVEISSDETGESLHDKLSELGSNLIVEALDKLEKGELKRTPQPDGELFYARMLTKEMGCIDWNKSSVEIERLIRGLSPWPGTSTILDGKTLKICSAQIGQSDNKDDVVGSICEVGKNSFTVKCKEGTIEVLSVKPEGKKEMSVHDFLLGKKIEKGTILGLSK